MNHAQTDGTGATTGSFRSYVTGFILSLILTFVAFGLVMSRMVSIRAVLAGIIVAAVIQIVVHLHYFLHLDTSSAKRWNLLALLFTLLIMVLFVGGSIWIMYNLYYRMM